MTFEIELFCLPLLRCGTGWFEEEEEEKKEEDCRETERSGRKDVLGTQSFAAWQSGVEISNAPLSFLTY